MIPPQSASRVPTDIAELLCTNLEQNVVMKYYDTFLAFNIKCIRQTCIIRAINDDIKPANQMTKHDIIN